MKELWEKAPKENVKTGVMVISFTKDKTPYCFVVESTSNPPFQPGPLVMPSKDNPIRVGAVCHDEEKFKSSNRLAKHLQLLIDNGIQLNHERLRESFDKVKNDLAKVSDEIGGNTFELILKP